MKYCYFLYLNIIFWIQFLLYRIHVHVIIKIVANLFNKEISGMRTYNFSVLVNLVITIGLFLLPLINIELNVHLYLL